MENGIFFTKNEFAKVCEKIEVFESFTKSQDQLKPVIDSVIFEKYSDFEVNWDLDEAKNDIKKLRLSFNRLRVITKHNSRNKHSPKPISDDEFLSPKKYPNLFPDIPVNLKPKYHLKFFSERYNMYYLSYFYFIYIIYYLSTTYLLQS